MMVWQTVVLTVYGLFQATYTLPQACSKGKEVTCIPGPGSLTESEAEETERIETDLMRVELLQSRISSSGNAIATGEEESESSHEIDEDSAAVSAMQHQSVDATMTKEPVKAQPLVHKDQNGKVCLLCGEPTPTRLGGKQYPKPRDDCGNYSTRTGPVEEALYKRAVEYNRPATSEAPAMNGFCQLNYAKSCADAIVFKDYTYWAKSFHLDQAAMKKTAAFDARYCKANGFLDASVVQLLHNFTGMQRKAQELCSTKYAKHGIENLTFLDMMKRSRYDLADAPKQEDAEVLAAWNCAMGDLGCDMAMCAYSFCEKADGSVGVYNECEGWDEVNGVHSK